MANKLKVDKKKTGQSRYFKGLSIQEIEDTEEAVESALENPAGTFMMVSQEHSFKLSAINKTVKSISQDTKYIRKAIDKLDKKIDDLDLEGGSGPFGSGGPEDLLKRGFKGGGGRGGRGPIRGGAGGRGLSNLLKKGGRLGGRLLGPAAYGALLYNYLVDSDGDYVYGTKPVTDFFAKNVFGIEGKTFDWKTGKKVANKPKASSSIKSMISDKMPTAFAPSLGELFKELTPTERAKIINERLKIDSRVPAYTSGVGSINPSDLGGIVPRTEGTAGGGGGGGAWQEDSKTPPVDLKKTTPSLTPSEFQALEKSNQVGIADQSTKAVEGGTYRPIRQLTEKDLSDDVVNVIAGEARTSHKEGVDAVINTMFNRLGTTGYGKSGNLEEVAMAGKGTKAVQYAGYRKASEQEAEMIRGRIKEIASGKVKDNTNGAQEFRAASYTGPWAQKHPEKVNIGGNNFAKNNDKTAIGPYASYAEARPQIAEAPKAQDVAAKVASQTTPSMAPVEAQVASIGDSKVSEKQQQVAAVRKLPIKPELKNALDYAASQAGVDKVEVFSGGQHEAGEGPRTGSKRHDHGNSADVYLYKDGKVVSMNSKEGQAIMGKFVSAARQAGATGIGAGPGYMGDGIHVGYGSELTWGAGGKSKNAPQWLRDAYEDGSKKESVDANKWIAEREKGKSLEVADAKAKKSTVAKTSDTDILTAKAKEELKHPPKTFAMKEKPVENTDEPWWKSGKTFEEAHPEWRKKLYPDDITPKITKDDTTSAGIAAAHEDSIKALEAAQAAQQQKPDSVIIPKMPAETYSPPPLSKLSKTAKKGVSNPTEKTPGADSSQMNKPPVYDTEDREYWSR